MTVTARARANAAQRQASDPAVSAFVSASAGSGKTKLLTDRLLRLLLAGAEPRRIQCLTYTKAAAAEMALRLRRDLAGWVTADDATLDASLAALGSGPAERERARALFARVIDLPGGMRIGTIHAFCQSLLRRFPLEAAVSPHFRLLADVDEAAVREQAQDEVLARERPTEAGREVGRERIGAALEAVAPLARRAEFDFLARDLATDRDRLAVLAALSPERHATLRRILLGVVDDPEAAIGAPFSSETVVREVLLVLAQRGAPAVKEGASGRLDWLAQDAAGRRAGWEPYLDSFVNADGKATAESKLVNDKLHGQQPELRATLRAEQARVMAIEDARLAARTAALSDHLLTLLLPAAEHYAAAKARLARLDYADLIERTTGLLRDPGAAWVLHKLDGGLDHLLLDEVQDTAPAQWAIAGALVAEFFAGDGAREAGRTVFAVGDRKQSIYSFQGAAPDAFDAWRGRLADMAGTRFRDVALDVSFRSTGPVLALVDAAFADPVAASGVVPPGEILRHFSDRVGQAGSVTLWPLQPRLPPPPPPDWAPPHRREPAQTGGQALVEHVANWIAEAVLGGMQLPSRGRPATPGDILVLVRRRAEAVPIVAALKRRDVPVAGLDRLQLPSQPAVADLLALCDALLLPQDDLAVACVLTSPLGGLDDDDLMALAPGRTGTLWDALRRRAGERPAWQAAWDFLAALFARVDYTTPHALLAEALGPLGGRARLLERLGPEAVEPIDELLAQALCHGVDHTPSLQGFVHWLRRSAADVKREAHVAGGEVRLMTVHGAKGLQAPIVILPDTTAPAQETGGLLWGEAEGVSVPVWAPHAEDRSHAIEALRLATSARDAEENRRLLYVALTRAEDRLVICGVATHRALRDDCWYRLVERGFDRLATEAIDTPTGPGRTHASEQRSAPDRVAGGLAAQQPPGWDALPAWAGSAPDWRPATAPEAAAVPVRLAPSRPRDAALGAVPASASPLSRARTRFARGRTLHALLQHLPDLPAETRPDAARRYLAGPAAALGAAEVETALAEVLGVLGHPALAAAFGPGGRAEVPLVAALDGQVVAGLVDRLAVLADRVLIVDYKTNRQPPDSPAAVPVLYLRQMAAYRAVLAALYPDRPVLCLLVWTEGASVMPLPGALLDSHAPAARQPGGVPALDRATGPSQIA